MKFFVIVLLFGIALIVIAKLLQSKLNKQEQKPGTSIKMGDDEAAAAPKDYSHSYQHRFLLSENEKAAFRKIKAVTDELGVVLLAKVRLFDLVEPKSDCQNYKGAMWKIQAKHVDFVICNKYLDAKLIIELDDSSHQRKDRQQRDEFVDEVLTNTGYTIIHANYINQDQLRQIISETVLLIPRLADQSAT